MIRNCIIAFLLTALVVVLMFPAYCEGSALDCESIRDPDHRHMCRAIAKNDKNECEFIRNHDLRAECRARTK